MSDLTAQTKFELRRSWAEAGRHGDRLVTLFYQRLFDMTPDYRSIFANSDMAAQHAKLADAISAVVENLDDLTAIVPVLHDLGAKHVDYGVRSNDYDAVGRALLWALERTLGRAFRPETGAAWASAFALVASVMQEGARQRAA